MTATDTTELHPNDILDAAILAVLLDETATRGINADRIAYLIYRVEPSRYFVQRVRAGCRRLSSRGEIQQDQGVMFHNTGIHWIHTFHAACRYVGNYRVDLGGKARQAAMHQYAPQKEHSGLLNVDVLVTQLNLLWAEVLDLRGQLPKQVK